MTTSRELHLETLLFGHPERIPLAPGAGRESTLKRWHAEGLPENEEDYVKYAYLRAGGNPDLWPEPTQPANLRFDLDARMIPQFEELVLEERENSRIVQDWKGNICEIGKEYTSEYLRTAKDFVTRRWLKCPVENRKDWDNMRRRYDANAPERLPANAAELGRQLQNRNWLMQWAFYGPFWQLREWVGFENLCVMFYDDTNLVRDMLAFWDDFIARLLQRALQYAAPDAVHISEDMAYKGFSMISPAMTREYLLPIWRHWGEIIRAAGVKIYAIDSDGFIGELIPIWIEAGFNVCDPVEVAAGNDIVAYRKKFGRQMAYRGGIDKRAMARGGRIIADEIARVKPVIDSGGYVPGCDHGVPPDVSWLNYVEYVRLLAQATGWLP